MVSATEAPSPHSPELWPMMARAGRSPFSTTLLHVSDRRTRVERAYPYRVDPRCGLFTGAGISADPPAGLPLGREFGERLLRHLQEAARVLVPGVAGLETTTLLADHHLNLLGRLQGCLGSGTVSDVLQCFRVTVPNEAHLIAAVHAARGTLHITLNFDDGVERAYALLSGAARLNGGIPAAYRHALTHWRKLFKPRQPLQVAAARFSAVDYAQGPLLVKLRGSAQEGLHPSLLPPSPLRAEVDAVEFSQEQLVAVLAVVATQRLVIAGVSGADADCRRSLIPLLRCGRFSWTAAALQPDVVELLRRIDPTQPRLAPALEGLRSSLPVALPDWPRIEVDCPRFDDLLRAWLARLPVHAITEAYAWFLCDAGSPDLAIPILQALLRHRDHPRTRFLLFNAYTACGHGCTPRQEEE
jgi:hypothetical protein